MPHPRNGAPWPPGQASAPDALVALAGSDAGSQWLLRTGVALGKGAAPIAGLAPVFAARLIGDGAGRGGRKMWARHTRLPILGALCVITVGVLMARAMR